MPAEGAHPLRGGSVGDLQTGVFCGALAHVPETHFTVIVRTAYDAR